MKQIAISSSGEVCVLEVPAPMCEDEGILVRVERSLISSGTEMASVTATSGTHTSNPLVKAIQNPALAVKAIKSILRNGVRETLDIANSALNSFQVTGYSCSGTVVSVGKKVRGFKIGDRVACAGVGYANHAEINFVPQNLAVPIPSNISFEEASFVTLATIAMQGVRQAKVNFGENVLVVGLGLVGQLTVQLLRNAGCRVIGVDLVDNRLTLGKEMGCNATMLASDPLYKEKVMQFTDGYGLDAVILTAGTKSSSPINQAMDLCRDRARVVVVGDVGMDLDRGPFFKKELEITISRSYGPGRYDKNYEEKGIDYPIGYARWTENRNMREVIRQIAEGTLKVEPLISAVYPIEEAFHAYGHIKDKPQETIAVIVRYETTGQGDEFSHVAALKKSATVSNNRVGFAVIGAGDFVKAVHLPNLKKSESADLIAVVTRNGVNAKQIADQYQAAYCSTDYKEILNDEKIHAVILGTRHNLRKEIILDLVRAKKHVYVEKPLALTVEDCKEIERAAAENHIVLTVGFNRRFSPCAESAYSAIKNLSGPRMMHYRVNAGPLPSSHWLLDPEVGGGRLLGEGVHFFDFLHWMSGGKPVEVIARGIHTNDQRYLRNDNMMITIVYDNGSVGSVLYTGTGNGEMGKERFEVFAGGCSVVIDDFKSTRHYGTGKADLELTEIDKGLAKSLEQFIAAIKGNSEIEITAHDGTIATWCAEEAVKSLTISETAEKEEHL